MTVAGVTRPYAVARDGDTLWIGRDGMDWSVHEQRREESAAAAGAGGPVVSPMPGTVTVVESSRASGWRRGTGSSSSRP